MPRFTRIASLPGNILKDGLQLSMELAFYVILKNRGTMSNLLSDANAILTLHLTCFLGNLSRIS